MKDNIISNLSYTQKDFESIYQEELDLASKLSHRWNPVESNESDPGVVLLKMNAIMADKAMYNIDKNVLENFPVSVQQLPIARQMYDQLGYHMKWYRAATTDAAIWWIASDDDKYTLEQYTLPMFTSLTDTDTSVVYSTVASRDIPTDGTKVFIPVIQGTVNHYELNGFTNITVANLDSHNRLYFNEENVAENGIFIANVVIDRDTGNEISNESLDWTEWKRVDNLTVESIGEKVYSLGTDINGVCYLEFPEDVQDLFGSGIKITYILTDGYRGNISRDTLSKFYTDSATSYSPDETTPTITFDATVVKITNYSSTDNGYDPETIDEAYSGYKKTVGTFNTLVTKRDYENAIKSSDLASNCFVSDRTNDIQRSFYVVSSADKFDQKTLVVEPVSETDPSPSLNAFNLTIYALQQVNLIGDRTSYDSTFQMNDSDSAAVSAIKVDLEENKLIPHDYSSILWDKICFIKNKYKVNLKVIPQYKLTVPQQNSVRKNINLAIYKKFCADNINFGDQISYDDMYDCIMSSDERIKSIILDGLNDDAYETYAMCFSSKYEQLVEVPINGSAYENITNEDYLSSLKDNKLIEKLRYIKEHYVEKFREEILVKNILAGITPLFLQDNSFNYKSTQTDGRIYNDIKSISTSVTMNFSKDYTYKIRENENVQFITENLIGNTSYSNGVRYFYSYNPSSLPSQDAPDVLKDSTITLSNVVPENEPELILVFFWKDEDDTDDTTLPYKYYRCKPDDIISPNFTLRDNKRSWNWSVNNSSPVDLTDLPAGEISQLDYRYTQIVAKANGAGLTGSKQITLKDKNITDMSKDYSKYDISFVTNKVVRENDTSYYEINFKGGEYILDDNEMFIYTDENRTVLYIASAGTKLSIMSKSGQTAPQELENAYIRVKAAVTAQDLAAEGLASTNDEGTFIPYKNLFKGSDWSLWLTEMQFVSLGEGVTLQLTSDQDFTIDNNFKQLYADSVFTQFQYKNESDETYTRIEKIDIADLGWKVRSRLHLNMSTEEPQHISDGSMYISVGGEPFEQPNKVTQIVELIPEDEDSDSKELINCYAQSNPTFVSYGGTDISAYVYDEDTDEPIPLDIYSYTESLTNVDEESKKDSYVIKFTTNEVKRWDISLPMGNKYVVAVNVQYSSKNVEGTISFNDGTVYNYDSINTSGRYYVQYDGIDSPTVSVTGFTGSKDDYIQVVFENIIGYTELNDSLLDDSWLETLNEYNKLSGSQFDYTYKVSEEVKIDNPLESKSFFNQNHVYNPYMICQLNVSEDTKDGSKLNPNIQIFNNVR